MTRKRRRSSGKRIVRRSNVAGLTALALCFTRQVQVQAPAPAVGVAGDAAASAATNLVFSPVSVYAALALLAGGACGGTLQELLDALGRDDFAGFARRTAERALADRSRSGGPAVAFACGAWLDAAAWALLPAFRDAAAASFNAEARAVDFGNELEKAVGEINACVAAATNKHIDSVLDPSSVNALTTTLVLTSAIYFKGRWEAPFAKAHTVVDKFHRLDGSVSDVPFMCSFRSQFIAIRSGYKVLKLPCRSLAPPPPPAPARRRKGSTPSESKPGPSDDHIPKYSLCVFLPDDRDGLPGLIKKMASGSGFWHYHLPTSQVPVGNFRLPRFKLSISSSVREVLSDDMGIKSAFIAGEADLADMATTKRDEADAAEADLADMATTKLDKADAADAGEADLADMATTKRDEDDAADAGTPPLYVADVCHKAVLEVNEGGPVTVGATANYMRCGASAVMDEVATVDFVADHPFLFFVIEEVSRAIVFVGRVLDPSVLG